MDTSSMVYISETKETIEYDSLSIEEKKTLWEKFTEKSVKSIEYEILWESRCCKMNN